MIGCCDELRPTLEPVGARFFDGLRTGSYDGHLEASTAVRLASLFRYALAITPLEAYQMEYGKIGTPSVVVDDLDRRAHAGHRRAHASDRRDQAPGQDRHRRHLAFRRDAAAGAAWPWRSWPPARRATRSATRRCARWPHLDPAVEEVTGWIRYRIEGDPATDDEVSVYVVDRGGIAAEIESRIERDPVLRGTKHTVAIERELLVFRGRRDDRTLIAIPETKDNHCTGITQLHVRFEDRLPVAVSRGVLRGYRNRYAALEGRGHRDRAELPGRPAR